MIVARIDPMRAPYLHHPTRDRESPAVWAVRAPGTLPDMASTELTSSWEQIGFVLASVAIMYVAIVAAVRMNGLRSFSKMSAFDFATTVAIGSLLATIAVSGSAVAEGLVAVAALLGLQAGVAVARRTRPVRTAIDNRPLLLMIEGRVLRDHLRRARVTEEDLHAKLRLAGVVDPSRVRYAVFESTGDISVATASGDLDERLLIGVDGAT